MPPVPGVKAANLVVTLDAKTEMVEEKMKQSDQEVEDSSEISNCRNLTCFLRKTGT